MKAIPIEELEAISPTVHEAAARLGCTHVRLSAPIWPGPAGEGPEGEEIRIVEYSWWRAILRQSGEILEEEDAAKFHAILDEYGMGDDEKPVKAAQPTPIEEPVSADNGASPAIPGKMARISVTAHVLPATKEKMEQQANEAGLSLGGLLDRLFAE